MEWIKFENEMPKDGTYYVKALMNNGQVCKLIESFKNGVWELGSGHLVIRLILEWLKEDDYEAQ